MAPYGPTSAFRTTSAPVPIYSRGYDGRTYVAEATGFSTPNFPELSPVVYPTQRRTTTASEPRPLRPGGRAGPTGSTRTDARHLRVHSIVNGAQEGGGQSSPVFRRWRSRTNRSRSCPPPRSGWRIAVPSMRCRALLLLAGSVVGEGLAVAGLKPAQNRARPSPRSEPLDVDREFRRRRAGSRCRPGLSRTSRPCSTILRPTTRSTDGHLEVAREEQGSSPPELCLPPLVRRQALWASEDLAQEIPGSRARTERICGGPTPSLSGGVVEQLRRLEQVGGLGEGCQAVAPSRASASTKRLLIPESDDVKPNRAYFSVRRGNGRPLDPLANHAGLLRVADFGVSSSRARARSSLSFSAFVWALRAPSRRTVRRR